MKRKREAKKVESVKIQSVDNAFFDVEADAEVPIPGTGRSLVETQPTVVQGFKHSLYVFNQVLKDNLQGMNLQSVLLQYVDDLLLQYVQNQKSNA